MPNETHFTRLEVQQPLLVKYVKPHTVKNSKWWPFSKWWHINTYKELTKKVYIVFLGKSNTNVTQAPSLNFAASSVCEIFQNLKSKMADTSKWWLMMIVKKAKTWFFSPFYWIKLPDKRQEMSSNIKDFCSFVKYVKFGIQYDGHNKMMAFSGSQSSYFREI